MPVHFFKLKTNKTNGRYSERRYIISNNVKKMSFDLIRLFSTTQFNILLTSTRLVVDPIKVNKLYNVQQV